MDDETIVIGAGAAGCAAALEAAWLGREALLVDPAPVPGAGALATGTIPAAVLREAALKRIACQGPHAAPHRSPSGSSVPFHGDELVERRLRVFRAHFSETAERLTSAGVHFLRGRASLHAPTEVSIEGCGIRRARTVVIATGTKPRRPASIPFDGQIICDEESILRLRRLPRSLVIVGAEVVGCEFACLFAALGVNVTLIERRRRLLRCADPEILEILHERMQRMGIVVALEEEIQALRVERGGVEAHAELRLGSGRIEKCDRLLVLAGRRPEIAVLGLERAGIEIDPHGFIQVDEHFQTSQPGVYAVGDVVGYPFRAGTGIQQARTALHHAAGRPAQPGGDSPIAIQTLPEISLVGLIEEAARRLDTPYGVGTARFDETLAGKLLCREPGLLKLLFHRDDCRLLGVQIIGPSARELIHLGAAWIAQGVGLESIAACDFNHPSLSEVYRAAALKGLLSIDAESRRTAKRLRLRATAPRSTLEQDSDPSDELR